MVRKPARRFDQHRILRRLPQIGRQIPAYPLDRVALLERVGA
jgi:hypothetical protein